MQNALPDSVLELKSMVLALQENSTFYKQEVNLLREQIRLLRQKLFGRKSEKLDISPEEMRLLFPDWEPEPPAVEQQPQEIKAEAHTRAKTGRKPIPDDLERVEVHHDLSEEEKICDCGATLSPMGTEQSEERDYVPAQYRVLVHIRHKYTCKSCQGVDSEGPTVKIAPPPAKILPKSMASSDLLSHIFVSKFCDAMPFYRQSGMFARDGIEISRASMCNWAIGVWERCQPLMEVLIREMRTGPVVYLDETTIQVLDEEGARKKERANRICGWVGVAPRTSRRSIFTTIPHAVVISPRPCSRITRAPCRPMAMPDITFSIKNPASSMWVAGRTSGASSWKRSSLPAENM